jgi:hypothetical protein
MLIEKVNKKLFNCRFCFADKAICWAGALSRIGAQSSNKKKKAGAPF